MYLSTPRVVWEIKFILLKRGCVPMAIDTDGIQRLVDQLDGLVPRDGACVRLEQYGGGSDESRFVANESGFLRFGIEFIKGGLAQTEGDGAGTDAVLVELDYLLSEESDVGFDWFIRNENLLSPEVKDGLIGIVFTLGFVLLGVLTVIGLMTVVMWLIKLVA